MNKPVQIIQTIDRKHFKLSIDIKYQSFPHQTKIWEETTFVYSCVKT